MSSHSELSKSVVIKSVLTSSPSGPTPCERDVMDRYAASIIQTVISTGQIYPPVLPVSLIVLTGSPGGPRGPRSPCNQIRTHQKVEQWFYKHTYIYYICYIDALLVPLALLCLDLREVQPVPAEMNKHNNSAHLHSFTPNISQNQSSSDKVITA